MIDLREYEELLTFDEAETIVLSYVLELQTHYKNSRKLPKPQSKWYTSTGKLKAPKNNPLELLESFYDNIDELIDMNIIRS